MEIRNYEEIKAQLEEMLLAFDIECNNYQTDVYLYIDEDGTGRLEQFVNVGGNSWLDDDHYLIHKDRQRNGERLTDHYTTQELARVLGMTEEELEKAAEDWEEGASVADYVEANHHKELEEDCRAWMPMSTDYSENAEAILERFEEEIARLEEEC